MAHPVPASWLADSLAPLGTAFGRQIAFARDGECACWSFAGQQAIVEMAGGGSLRAHFVASALVYARENAAYPLTPAGCERMVADMLAFFSGIREPRFTFVDVR